MSPNGIGFVFADDLVRAGVWDFTPARGSFSKLRFDWVVVVVAAVSVAFGEKTMGRRAVLCGERGNRCIER